MSTSIRSAVSLELSERKVPTDARPGEVIENKYELTELITSGSSGEVWCAKEDTGTRRVAIKIMFVEGQSVQATRAREVGKLIDDFPNARGARYLSTAFGSGTYSRHPCLFYDLHGMNIRTLFNTSQVFPFPAFQIRAILWQVCMGVAFLHRLDIVHTDIKPENIVFVDDALTTIQDIDCEGRFYDKRILKNIEIRIVDLDDSVSRPRNLHYIPGTPGYRPPEVHGRNGWSFPVDVFAIGCLAYELFVGVPLIPWTEDVQEYLFVVERLIGRFGVLQAQDICDLHPQMFRTKTRVPRVKVTGMRPKSKSSLLRYVSEGRWQRKCITEPDIKQFISLCTKVDPHQRLSIESTIRHRIFNEFSKVHRISKQ